MNLPNGNLNNYKILILVSIILEFNKIFNMFSGNLKVYSFLKLKNILRLRLLKKQWRSYLRYWTTLCNKYLLHKKVLLKTFYKSNDEGS